MQNNIVVTICDRCGKKAEHAIRHDKEVVPTTMVVLLIREPRDYPTNSVQLDLCKECVESLSAWAMSSPSFTGDRGALAIVEEWINGWKA